MSYSLSYVVLLQGKADVVCSIVARRVLVVSVLAMCLLQWSSGRLNIRDEQSPRPLPTCGNSSATLA